MAETLQMHCRNKGIKMAELAKRCGISQSYLSRIANGARTKVDVFLLTKLAQELDISLVELEFLIAAGKSECSAGDTLEKKEELTEIHQCIQDALDALEHGNMSMFHAVAQKARKMNDSVPRKRNFLAWCEGVILILENRYAESLVNFESAIFLKPKYGIEKKFLAKIVSGLGSINVAMGNYHSAMQFFRKSLMIWKEGSQAGSVYLNMGTLYRRRHLYSLAIDFYERALELGESSVKLMAYTGLGQIGLDRKNIEQARQYLLRGYVLAKSQIRDEGKGNLYCNLGQYYKQLGQLGKAIRFLKIGLEHANRWGDTRIRLYILTELADAYMQTRDLKALNETLKQLEPTINQSGDVLLVGKCFNTLAKRHVESRHTDDAIALLNGIIGYWLGFRCQANC